MIVDDSTVARAVLSRMVASNPDFEVVALAGNSNEALDALRSVKVDIVLLDVEMPGTSGLEALPAIIKAGRGARVLIVSSMAEDGAEVTVRALAEGAADTLPKPGTGYFAGRFSEVLADRLRRIGRAGRSDRDKVPGPDNDAIRLRDMPDRPLGCVALGASTGGLHALVEFLRALPARIGATILVTQHLPTIFMPISRGSSVCFRRAACAADEGQLLTMISSTSPGRCPSLCRTERRQGAGAARLQMCAVGLPVGDPMLSSVADIYGEGAVGVILSGMGRDGLVGSQRVVEQGGAMMAQDQVTSAIWGMARAVAEAGLASAVLPPGELARRIGQRVEASSWK
jgi:two-component system chemotaxis response regulator CheB